MKVKVRMMERMKRKVRMMERAAYSENTQNNWQNYPL